jgi:hypothetical protein
MITAEDLAAEIENDLGYEELSSPTKFAALVAIEFAKLHVTEALRSAAKQARIIDDPGSYTGNTGSEYPPDQIVDQSSIFNSYDLSKIK